MNQLFSDPAFVISLLTAIALLVKSIADGRNSTTGTKSNYLTNLITNVENLTKQNLSLQTQLDDKQEQIDGLKTEMNSIAENRFDIQLQIRAGKNYSIDKTSIQRVHAEEPVGLGD